ncbi:sugar ABC transporter ATP-binding protein [Saccharopolyspora rectivirgula]|jgi:ribose transport system ATP-binding protein|uniref:Sugar ABC transporter ATP-binding protein n=1 Tax=Saccharopolyspora rectivirgula TaxID=28042 RepID=A0A073B6H9_9PSEU|nr:sugar ABC transporter ATP-binding protein [Saccharopolyspora rectivirgula]KEI43254.1 sugar ABC transporter ATP-binding protein [Saccharopolyspora rectivirgula]
MRTGQPLVEMAGITKRYGGVLACDEVDLTIRSGEVHALLGENGAGKSTLMRVLSGDLVDYEGKITVEGHPVEFSKPAEAQRAGIAMIHQELDLVPALSVAENLYLGREPRTRYGAVDRRKMASRTRELLRRTGIELDPFRPVGQLRVGEQQLVVIARALSLNAKVLIMDEPTSALSAAEVDQLFAVIDELRRAGTGIVYISHRMDEIGRIADRATVLRNGRVVGEFDARDLTAEKAAEAMVGTKVEEVFNTRRAGTGEELLRLSGFALQPRRTRTGRREPNGIDLTVHRGEIVGLCGLLGAGRTELLETLFGAGTPGTWRGTVTLDGRPVLPRNPRQALRAGIAFVPEDRRMAGLVLEHSVLANTVLSVLDRLGAAGLVRKRKERSTAAEVVRRLNVKLGRLTDPVGSLSGGNQQKVVFGRMLLTEPRLLLLDDPTRGVDIGAKAEIYQLLQDIAARGIGVLLASSEIPELVGVCHRVVVLRGGRSVAEFNTTEVSEAELLAAAMGETLTANSPGPVAGTSGADASGGGR